LSPLPPVFASSYCDPRHLHSFPTRRSSDLTFVIFIVGFIPVLGGAVAGCAPPLFALVQFESYWQAAVLFVGLQVLLFLVGNLVRSEEHTSELQSRENLVCRLLLEKNNRHIH